MGWAAFVATVTFVFGLAIGAGLISKDYAEDAKHGFLEVNDQLYRIEPLQVPEDSQP